MNLAALAESAGKLAGLRERLELAADSAKKNAVKGLLAHHVASALVSGAAFLVLGGTTWGLATLIHPALAAVLIGGGVLAVIIIGALLAVRSK